MYFGAKEKYFENRPGYEFWFRFLVAAGYQVREFLSFYFLTRKRGDTKRYLKGL